MILRPTYCPQEFLEFSQFIHLMAYKNLKIFHSSYQILFTRHETYN